VNRAPLDAAAGRRPAPEIVFKHLMEGIGLALDLKGGRMFITDLTGTVYSANLDGSDKKTLLVAQGNLTGVAYAELPVESKGKASKSQSGWVERNGATDLLTKAWEYQLGHPAPSPVFDRAHGVKETLAVVGLTTADSGGTLTFSGQDPILPSPF